MHARRIETVLAPFFPRYFFVVLNIERDPWRSVNGTFGVSRLIMRGDRPQAVPKGIVEALLEIADERGVLRFDTAGGLRVGQAVKIMTGPFADQISRIERIDVNGRVRLLLELLGQRARVEISGADVIPATA